MQLRSRGFSLMEALVVAIVLAMLGAVMMTMMLTRTKHETRTDFREVESRELSLLYSATKAFMNENPTAFSTTPTELALSTLISNAKLPDDFATRDGVMGKTPWRQDYRIYVTVDASDNEPRAVILEGSPSASVPALNRTGMEATPQAIESLKLDIAVKTMSTYKIPAATIEAGTKSARGAMNAWTKDLTAFLPTAPTEAAAAVLVGFPDLEPQPPNVEINLSGKWKNCTLQAPNMLGAGGPEPPSCPVGQQNLVHVTVNPTTGAQKEGFPYCRLAHYLGAEPAYTTYPTDIGNITIGREVASEVTRGISGWTCSEVDDVVGDCLRWTANFGTYESTTEGERIFLNGAEIADFPGCKWSATMPGYRQGAICQPFEPPMGEAGCTRSTSGRHEAVVSLGSDARVLLCCEEVTP